MRHRDIDVAVEAGKALADRLFPSGEEAELADSILDVPPEQRKLHTETFDFAVTTLRHYLSEGKVTIPAFQRRSVWTDVQASRLIESLIIQCPIPVIYLSQTPEERLEVIDGNQRLTSIRRFLDDELVLRGLTSYPELAGSTFSTLDPRFQRHIENRTLRCITILKDTHPQVKFDVFERLNTGSTKLSAQELRNGIYNGTLTAALAEIARSPEWRTHIRGGQTDRMKSEELALRFLAFYYDRGQYRKPLASFLSEFCRRHRNCSVEESATFKGLCIETLRAAAELLGPSAFCVVDERGEPLRGLNAALFEAEMLAVANLGGAGPEVGRDVAKAIGQRLSQDYQFYRSVTYATSDEQSVMYRQHVVQDILSSFI